MKAEPAKTEPAKAEQPKKAEPKPAEQQVQAGGKKFGLQCGAFKNRAQAESLQGRLATVSYTHLDRGGFARFF